MQYPVVVAVWRNDLILLRISFRAMRSPLAALPRD